MDHALVVGDQAEQDRFWSHVVRGPADADCWIWTGAISDDGYGRWWIRRPSGEHIIRPHRYALALAHGGRLDADDIAMHLCDNPICVRIEQEPLGSTGGRGSLAHVVHGTQSQNLTEMARKGRGGGRRWPGGWYGPDRAARAERSRALRDAVQDGWNPQAVTEALTHTDHPTLF